LAKKLTGVSLADQILGKDYVEPSRVMRKFLDRLSGEPSD
jgi:hypothetical protein